MELLNATKMQAGYTLGIQADGRELLVVAVKGTFKIPHDQGEPRLGDAQVPLVEADIFTGEPGFSAPIYESDYAPHKPRCDVLLNGSAYAPGGRSTTRVRVSLQVGSFLKTFDVVGNRVWRKRLLSIGVSKPQPFTVMPISYNNAFGGIDNTHKKEKKHCAYLTNHVGVGFHSNLKAEFVNNKPLPNTEEAGRPVRKPRGKYRPMAFGPLGRNWQPRPSFAGTFDQKWVDNVFPFLPSDFREEYHQAAPPDQQISYPRGGEEVVLKNLTRSGETRFRLPTFRVPVEFTNSAYERTKVPAVVDTVLIEPDLNRVVLVWRVSLPLQKNVHEIRQVVVGEMQKSWYRARDLGKTYFPSLRHLISSNRGV